MIETNQPVFQEADGGRRATREYALIGGDPGRVHHVVHDRCAAGTGGIACSKCRSLRIERLVPITAFAERGDVGRVIADTDVRAVRATLLPPPAKRPPIQPRRNPLVRMRAIEGDGGPSERSVPSAVRRRYGWLRGCFEKHGLKHQKPEVHQGSAVVSIVMGYAGRVREARIEESTLRNPKFGECIVNKLLPLELPTDSEGAVRTYEFAFELFPAALPGVDTP